MKKNAIAGLELWKNNAKISEGQKEGQEEGQGLP